LLAAAEDEISFDPDDIITNVEMVSCFTSGEVSLHFSIMICVTSNNNE